MSWLSDVLDHAGPVGKAINSVGGPIVNVAGAVAHSIPGVGTIEDALRAAGDNLGANPLGGSDGKGGGSGLPTSILGILQGLNTAQLGAKSSNFADEAANTAKDAYNAKAPLRSAGIAGMLNPQTADLSRLDALSRSGNPFARVPSSPLGALGTMPMPAPTTGTTGNLPLAGAPAQAGPPGTPIPPVIAGIGSLVKGQPLPERT